ncbi:MAG: Gfo/Idh/MocA family oxidoreductase [Clostridiales Family XIII bacterium]|jgi:predicted dehydrogenase|nr:Gfo/Idh/MocA family oxidoreductase [Clostridiales Family XIII bacterium]
MLNAVLIGFGYWGPNIAKNLFRSADFDLYGICDIDEAKREKAHTAYGDSIRYFADYKDVMEDASVDVCAVALRNEIGQEVARAALSSGKHLFMEKPMATNMSDALLLKSLSEQNSVVLQVDHILVFNPFIRRIKAILDSGELGDLIAFESNRANLGPHIKKDMNAMWDLAVHDIAVLDYLCGGKEPIRVNCLGERRYGDQEILTYLTIKYDGFIAMIKSSWFSPLKNRMMTVSGTKKMIVFDDLQDSEKLLIYDKGVEISDRAFAEYGNLEMKMRAGDLHVPYIEFEDALLNGLTSFANCIKTGRPSESGPDQAIRVLKILEQADIDMQRTDS